MNVMLGKSVKKTLICDFYFTAEPIQLKQGKLGEGEESVEYYVGYYMKRKNLFFVIVLSILMFIVNRHYFAQFINDDAYFIV